MPNLWLGDREDCDSVVERYIYMMTDEGTLNGEMENDIVKFNDPVEKVAAVFAKLGDLL